MYHLVLYLPYFILLPIRGPPQSAHFPYTTLFRSQGPVTIAVRATAGGETLTDEALATVDARAAAPSATPEAVAVDPRSEEHTSELQSPCNLVCRLLLEKKKKLLLNHIFKYLTLLV